MTRTSRAQETRAAEEVHPSYTDTWESPALLDTKNIPARDGYVQRWVRTQIRGTDDQNNVFKKINQGWQPRALDSVAKGQFIPHVDFNGLNVIGIHGMILMERPEKMHERHAEYNRQQTANQMQAAEQNLFKVHKEGSGLRRPSMKNKTTVTRGRLADPDDD